MKRLSLLLPVLAGMVASSALASLTVVPTTGSADGTPPGTLYSVMQTLLRAPGYNVNNAANRVDDAADQAWASQPNAGVGSTLILEIAANRSGNEFGIYRLGSTLTTDKVAIFSGPDSAVKTTAVTVPAAWGGVFGFYVANQGATFYSEQALNGGKDNMVTLKNDGPAALTLSSTLFFVRNGWTGLGSATWNRGEYLLAWEDLKLGIGAEPDYQDLLVKVNAVPVPEPATILTGALLLLPFGARTLSWLTKRTSGAKAA